MTKTNPIGYHGVENVKYAPKTDKEYTTSFIPLANAKNLGFTSTLEDSELYADNQLLARIPNDKGYTAEFGTTALLPDLEKAAGYSIDAASGVIGSNVVQYLRGALYYEFTEIGADKKSYKVKVWAYNAEIGKGALNHSTDEKSITFGEYKYPITIYGDPLMDAQGAKAYIDELGMGRMAFMYTSRPWDTGYETFGDAVPIPKVKTAAPPAGG